MRRVSVETDRILPGLCNKLGLEMPDVYEKSRKILKSRNEIPWIPECPDGVDDIEVYYYSEEELLKSIKWLEGYYNGLVAEEGLLDQVSVLWESGFMGQIIKLCMEQISDFRKQGKNYYTLIQKHYLEDFQMTEQEFMESLNMSRTTYYQRLKEAITLFGILLFTEITQWDPQKVAVNE